MTAPLYLQGHLAPVADETEGHDLPVTGALPPELSGRYVRNGPNPRPGQDPRHWFIGDGMLHGVRLENGRARWYRNRWVRTAARDGASYIGPDGRPDLTAVTANTSVIRHAGRILALVESGLPHQVSDELDTLGPYDFGGRLTTAMTAHPKEDPATGELHFFGYGAVPPFLTYHRATAAGELAESREIPVPGPTMMHDFAITDRHVVWLDLPVTFDARLLGRGMPYRWDDGYGARIGVMPQRGTGAVRWLEVEPGYVFHVGNAREDAAGRIVLDAVRYDRDAFAGTWDASAARPATHRRAPARGCTGGCSIRPPGGCPRAAWTTGTSSSPPSTRAWSGARAGTGTPCTGTGSSSTTWPREPSGGTRPGPDRRPGRRCSCPPRTGTGAGTVRTPAGC